MLADMTHSATAFKKGGRETFGTQLFSTTRRDYKGFHPRMADEYGYLYGDTEWR